MTDAEYVLVDGDSELDWQIRDLYNAGWQPIEIANKCSCRFEYVLRRLRSLERYGEVKKRKGGGWTSCVCSVEDHLRTCGVARPSTMNHRCRLCKQRIVRGGENR